MVTHLFFADDCLLFCKATDQECQKLTDILELYEAASGQKVNANKSSVFFNHNTPKERRSERFGKKLARWKEKMLSIGGKEVLIKVVAQTIPMYPISCFLLPNGLCKEIEGMIRKFW